ncbi:hypothetical protein TM7_0653 [candidate division TM7 genomosp. GTL1]|nr:hypothetical protein TM7_0653 [candidate division TM7 genomosp. GTL1]
MRPLFFTFIGDEAHDYSAVWAAHPGWLAITYEARDFARWCGLDEISPQTMERWLRMWALVYVLDSLLDDTPLALRQKASECFERMLTTAEELPEWIDTDAISLVALLRAAIEELEEGTWDTWVQTAFAIRDIGVLRADEYRSWPHLRLLVREAKLTAQLAFICMNAEERRRRIRYRRFAGAFTYLAIGGGLYDHARDLYGDHAYGLTAIQPSRLNARLILVRGILEVAKFLFYPRIATTLFRLRRHRPRLRLMAYWLENEAAMGRIQAEELSA